MKTNQSFQALDANLFDERFLQLLFNKAWDTLRILYPEQKLIASDYQVITGYHEDDEESIYGTNYVLGFNQDWKYCLKNINSDEVFFI